VPVWAKLPDLNRWSLNKIPIQFYSLFLFQLLFYTVHSRLTFKVLHIVYVLIVAGASHIFVTSIQNSQHGINCSLPDTRNTAYVTRRRNHPYELTYYHYSWSRCSFVNRSLYNFIWCMVFILYYFEQVYNQCPYNVFSCMYIHDVLLCVLNTDKSISNNDSLVGPGVARSY